MNPAEGSEAIEEIARRAAARALAGQMRAGLAASGRGDAGGAANPGKTGGIAATPVSATDSRDAGRELVAESLVRAAAPGSALVIPPGARLTPLARELAFEKNVTFTTGRYAQPLGPSPGGGGPARRIVVASDHGGFELKRGLMGILAEMGERAIDLGPDRGDVSVDYPDFAARVAAEVSSGRAGLGIIVDGAGIGSAMVAGKFPGVLAANCWDVRTARNAREHNHANVLTLGSGHLDLAAARAVLAAFLATPVGEGRHQRRRDKTRDVEARWLRGAELESLYDEGRS